MYQSVSRKDAVAYIIGRHEGSVGAHDLQVSYPGTAAPDWVDDVLTVLDEVLATWGRVDLKNYSSDQARDEMEGILSAKIHEGLRLIPATVLTDRNFWRYCSTYLYDFVVWRQPSSAVSALYPYFGVASDSLGTECVPHRMFNRAHIARAGVEHSGDAHPYALASFGAADVWKSHILRTRNSYAPVVVHEILVDVQGGKLPTDPVRLLAKNLKRVRSNVLFEVLDQHQARSLVDREKQRVATTLAGSRDSESSGD